MPRKRNHVLFLPDWRDGNPYLELLATGLKKQKFSVSFDDYPNGFFKLNALASKYPDVRIIHVHWIAELIAPVMWAKSRARFRIKLWLLGLDCLLCRLRGVRLIWTVHNLVEHESNDEERELEIRRLLFNVTSSIIIHSVDAARAVLDTYQIKHSKSINVIPHGNYVGIYKEDKAFSSDLVRELVISDTDIVLLFFGLIRRYKGLEALIDAFREIRDTRYRLVIAGRPTDAELETRIKRKIACDPRICVRLGFIPNEQVASYFRIASAVVLPFQRTLTSGSVILAMSMGRCLVLPTEARVLGIPGDEGAVYYTDDSEIKDALDGIAAKDLAAMGQWNSKMAAELRWDEIAARTTVAYG